MECQGTAKEWLEPSPGGWGSEGLPGRPVRGLIPRGSIIVKEVRSKKTGIPAEGTTGGKSQKGGMPWAGTQAIWRG